MQKQEDIDFFAQIWKKHEKMIYKICHHYEKSEEARRDLYQEILLQWWRALPLYRSEAKISSFLYRIGLNVAISYLRAETRRVETVEMGELGAFLPSFEPNPEDERLQKLHEAIAQLPKIDKAIMLLYLDGYQYEEIAQMVGLNSSHIGVKLSRIKEKIKKQLHQ